MFGPRKNGEDLLELCAIVLDTPVRCDLERYTPSSKAGPWFCIPKLPRQGI